MPDHRPRTRTPTTRKWPLSSSCPVIPGWAPVKCTLQDGAIAKATKLHNTIRPRAAVTSLQTSFEVVWYKAHRNIWLHYNVKWRAQAAQRALQGLIIAGVRINCHFKEFPNLDGLKFRVQLQHVPNEVQLLGIRQHLPKGMDPKRTIFGKLNYPTEGSGISHICEKIRVRTGERLKQQKFIDVENGMKQKAEIILSAEPANLAAHAKALDGQAIPQLRMGRCASLKGYKRARLVSTNKRKLCIATLQKMTESSAHAAVRRSSGLMAATTSSVLRARCTSAGVASSGFLPQKGRMRTWMGRTRGLSGTATLREVARMAASSVALNRVTLTCMSRLCQDSMD